MHRTQTVCCTLCRLLECQWVKRMVCKNRKPVFKLPFCCSDLQFCFRQTKPNFQNSSYRHDQCRLAAAVPESVAVGFYGTCVTDAPMVPECLPAVSLLLLPKVLRGRRCRLRCWCWRAGRCAGLTFGAATQLCRSARAATQPRRFRSCRCVPFFVEPPLATCS